MFNWYLKKSCLNDNLKKNWPLRIQSKDPFYAHPKFHDQKTIPKIEKGLTIFFYKLLSKH